MIFLKIHLFQIYLTYPKGQEVTFTQKNGIVANLIFFKENLKVQLA